ncbi:MAG TPA: 16S rRNA (cytosine(1402)-N(4))-methyltransferase RsmH [Gemmatimonadaceae bacterium]|nr:16S rRNA (cytosine(1402)-N(4))-methyltransferase RsmH [Gemmatimonadaceae bacterium]
MTPTREGAYHEPVMAGEIVDLLRSAKTVLDGTLGGGGHSEALLEAGVRLVIGVDRDPEAIAAATKRLAPFTAQGRFRAVRANYADVAGSPAIEGALDGVLLDLGVSSHQLDDEARGFTFREGAVLDMRMGDAAATAAEFLNDSDERTLAAALRDYGDEPRAGRLAREIVRRRATAAFATSDDLVNAIRGALGPKTGPGDFARIFQAVRIAVNDELSGLAQALPALRDAMAPGGVMAVITYHSGEDRLVKHTFREWSTDCVCPPRQPRCTCGGRSLGEVLTRRAVLPSDEERERNPRARSAKLRAWRKAGAGA